jgi:hypothetical protein
MSNPQRLRSTWLWEDIKNIWFLFFLHLPKNYYNSLYRKKLENLNNNK